MFNERLNEITAILIQSIVREMLKSIHLKLIFRICYVPRFTRFFCVCKYKGTQCNKDDRRIARYIIKFVQCDTSKICQRRASPIFIGLATLCYKWNISFCICKPLFHDIVCIHPDLSKILSLRMKFGKRMSFWKKKYHYNSWVSNQNNCKNKIYPKAMYHH